MSPWYRALPITAISLALVLGASACEWRAETPPLERRTPSPSVATRDQAALREQAVRDASGTSLMEGMADTMADAHLTALGGVYVATPGATPSPSVSPSGDTAGGEPSVADAMAIARDEALADAAETDDASLTALLRSISLSYELALWATANPAADVAERPMPEAPTGALLVPEAVTSVDADTLAQLAAAHDQAGFVYETSAARDADDARTAALERARLHRARAAALVALPGVEDLREELYTVESARFADTDSRRAYEAELEGSLGWNYAALAGAASTADAGWLLNASFDAYAAQRFLTDDWTFPDLPGITSAS